MRTARQQQVGWVPWVAGGVGALVVAVVVIAALASGGGTTHVLFAGFDNAIQMTPGQQVRIAGRPVGEIGNIKLDKQTHTAVVKLNITAKSAWPLPKGTYAVARWGSTTAYLGRYTELIPGPAKNPPLPDGGILTAQQDSTAFELDQAYNIFRGRTAGDTGRVLTGIGATLHKQGKPLQRGLAAAPNGLNQTADILSDLSNNDYDLRTLATAGDRTVSALASRSTALQGLVTNAAGTFSEFAQHTTDEQQALDKAPRAFSTATSLFGRLDTSIDGLTTLVNDIKPGARPLAQLAGTASSAFRTLKQVAPIATATLKDGIASAPSLTRLFKTGQTFLPTAGSTLRQASPMVACIRPYAPDIAGFLTTWTGMASHYDAGGHYARAFELTVIPALLPGTTDNAATAIKASPGISYAFPRPPGLNQGHPYFVPQCGVTQDALNPADDPEAGRGR